MPSRPALLAVQHMYSEHHRWLSAWLQRRLSNRRDAEDVAHDTFLRILASRDAIASILQPRAFLTTTAKRPLVDRARRQAIEQAYLEQLGLLARDRSACAPAPEAIVTAVEALTQIAMALDGLAARPREAFVLHYLDEQPQAEIAQGMGVSKRMVQKYLAQALVHCRRQCASLAEHGY